MVSNKSVRHQLTEFGAGGDESPTADLGVACSKGIPPVGGELLCRKRER